MHLCNYPKLIYKTSYTRLLYNTYTCTRIYKVLNTVQSTECTNLQYNIVLVHYKSALEFNKGIRQKPFILKTPSGDFVCINFEG